MSSRQAELNAERELENLKRLQADSGLLPSTSSAASSAAAAPRLEWMYDPGAQANMVNMCVSLSHCIFCSQRASVGKTSI